jgi:hypothetical protein
MKTTLTITSDKAALFEAIPHCHFTKVGQTENHTVYEVDHFDAADLFYFGQYLGLAQGERIWNTYKNGVNEAVNNLNF